MSLPPGRVFFSSALLNGDGDDAYDVPASEIYEAPNGLKLLNSGGLTIKKNTLLNLWGALGDVNLILGRYALSGGATEIRKVVHFFFGRKPLRPIPTPTEAARLSDAHIAYTAGFAFPFLLGSRQNKVAAPT